MSRKELKRYKVIDRWIQGSITGGEAAELLGLSDRPLGVDPSAPAIHIITDGHSSPSFDL